VATNEVAAVAMAPRAQQNHGTAREMEDMTKDGGSPGKMEHQKMEFIHDSD